MRRALRSLLPGGLLALLPRGKSRHLLLAAVLALAGLTIPAAAPAGEEEEVFELIEGTAILLNQSSGSGSGGNNKTTSSSTHIFAPAAYVDYKRFGGEPTVVVDRYPFLPGQFGAPATEYRDLTYQSAPNGLPTYSQFWKSDDLAATFRKPRQVPVHGLATAALGGGGDSHQVVGHLTHRVYFTDLPLDCISVNTSRDLGETFTPDPLGCGAEPGLDDRQWIEEDEAFGPTPCLPASSPLVNCGNVYISFINFANAAAPTLSFARSQKGALAGSFATDSLCNTATMSLPPTGAPDGTPTVCPDPADSRLQVAGPPVADKVGMTGRPPTHAIYIPFVRATPILPALTAGPPYDLYIARSLDGGNNWTRHLVAHRFDRNPINIFPQLTLDRGGNLYYTWSEAQGPQVNEAGFAGEQDIFYTFSKNGGLTWAAPIDLTKERNDSAVFPWMVAGDPGQVDIVYYKSNSGINSNFAFFDEEGNECEEGEPGCRENQAVWNVYFGQSQNALNTGPNFKSVQVSAAPNHIGQVCTAGLACEGDRSLLDFFTVDVDHLGAAVIAYSDTNYSLGISRDHTTRQISGNGVYKNQSINLQSSWPIRDHSAFDRADDVYDTAGVFKDSCPGMDILKTTADRRDSLVTITMTLNSAPTAAEAIACGGEFVTGGVWGAEFWATSFEDGAQHYYIAYRDDLTGGPRTEGGAMDNFNIALTSLDFQSRVPGTLSGTCFPPSGPATGECTIAMTADVSSLGITPGNALLSLTGVSAWFFGHDDEAPFTRILLGNSEQADATAAIHYLGSGTP